MPRPASGKPFRRPGRGLRVVRRCALGVLGLVLLPPPLLLRPLDRSPWESNRVLAAAVEEARAMHRIAGASEPGPLFFA